MTTVAALLRMTSLPAGRLLPDVHGFEPLLAPVDHEDAEALAHALFDVVRRRRIAARDVELLARREHLLDGRFPTRGIEHALARRIDGRENAAQRAGAGEEHRDAFHRRDLANVLQPFL